MVYFFMLQVKICTGLDYQDLQASVNDALSKIDYNEPKIIWDKEKFVAIIEYIVNESYKRSLCCECQYWQENGHASMMGMCQNFGKRKRFDCKACASWKDVRDE